jgi:hypothetical protein
LADDADKKSDDSDGEKTTPADSKIGRFIQKYHSFLSTFVIGAAGLIATSIWQYRQSEIARRQADSQQQIATTQAENSWRIERAEILAKNLQVLASGGGAQVEQRYGVLLSLTRGNILDPELAVSYALELGKDNPEYMRSVLAGTANKDYTHLLHAYDLTCDQRYGVTRAVDACKKDKLAARSAALADLVSDEVQSFLVSGNPSPSPLGLLKDERQVQLQAAVLGALFTPALTALYGRRQWNEVARFEASSTGAHLVAALVLAAARTGEFVTADEASTLERFHADHRQWLTRYLLGATCDATCKGKLIEVMLTYYAEARGDYDTPVRTLLERPRNESGEAMARLHTRLLWCQVDDDDLAQLRDRVLVPALAELVAAPKAAVEIVEDLVGLVALVPPPVDAQALAAWKSLLAGLEKQGHFGRLYQERRAIAQRDRAAPPPALKRLDFCNAAKITESAAGEE